MLRNIVFGCLFTLASAASAQDRIAWITDLRQARDVAEREQRLVLLHFWSPDCAPCMRLDRYVFNQPELIRAISTGYVPVKIDARQHPNLAQHYNIQAVPTDVVVTPEGREIHRATSPQDTNQYIAMLDGVRANASVSSRPAANSQPTASASSDNRRLATNPDTTLPQGQPPAVGSSSQPIENKYFHPLGHDSGPQEQRVAPRYANPYQNPQPGASEQKSAYDAPHMTTVPAQPTQGQGASYDTGNRYAPRQAPADGSPLNVPAAHTQMGPDLQPQNSPVAETNRWQPERTVQQVASLNAAPHPQPPAGLSQAPSNDPALDGYCPVTLVHNRHWTPGDKQWGAVHENRIYLFAGPEQQRQFLANPGSFAPLLSGYDPVRYAETGQLVPGKREFGLYVDSPGPIALFADEPALERFQANADFYLSRIRQAQPAGQVQYR